MSPMFEAIKNQVTPAMVAQLSAQTGESQTAVVKGLDAMIPALLASFANRSDDPRFMSQLADLASKAPLNGGAVARTPPPVGAQASDLGLPGLFNRGTSALMENAARFAGLKTTSASTLLATVAPLVLGYLGRLMRADGLDAGGLADRLHRERQSLSAAIPSGLDIGRQRSAKTGAAAHNGGRSRSSLTWLVPVILAAVSLAGLFWVLSRDRAEGTRSEADLSERPTGTAGTVVDSLTRRLPGNITLTIPRGGMEDRLTAYLAAPTAPASSFTFDRIGFNFGSATLTVQSQEQIRNIAQVLKAYPSTRITIEGYTDNVGDPAENIALSRARAETVLNALAGTGVSTNRMQATGFGSGNPVADNETAIGRARNRRVVMRIEQG